MLITARSILAKVFLFLSLFSCCFGSTAITWSSVNGRFGDHLMGYLHAKWVSYQFGIPLLYKPFKFSEEFALDDQEELWTKEKEVQLYSGIKKFRYGIPLQDSFLYVIPFFSECSDDYRSGKPPFVVDYKDTKFRSLLRAAFTLKKKRPKPSFPEVENLLTVALHVRRGGDWDPKDPHKRWPLRFVPDSYYLESLRLIADLFPSRPIYAYIFTDDALPGHIADTYAEALADLPIQFDCRREGNHHASNVLEDFISMMEYDCLIRSASNYSFVSSIIAEHQVVISPKHYVWRVGPDGNSKENYIDEKNIDHDSRTK